MVPGQSPGSRPEPRGESVGGTQFPTTASRGPGATPDSLGDSESGPAGIRFRTSLQVTAVPGARRGWERVPGRFINVCGLRITRRPRPQHGGMAQRTAPPPAQPCHGASPRPGCLQGPPPRVGRYPTRRKLARLRKPFAKAPRIDEQSIDSGQTTSNAVCDTESRRRSQK